MMEGSPPPNECCPDVYFGATKRQASVLRIVCSSILGLGWFAALMTESHKARVTFAALGLSLAVLWCVVGVAWIKYTRTPQHTVVDQDFDEEETIIAGGTPSTPVLGVPVPGGMNSGTLGLMIPHVEHDNRLDDSAINFSLTYEQKATP